MQPVVGKMEASTTANWKVGHCALNAVLVMQGSRQSGSNPVYKSDPAKSQAHRVEGNVTTAVLIY